MEIGIWKLIYINVYLNKMICNTYELSLYLLVQGHKEILAVCLMGLMLSHKVVFRQLVKTKLYYTKFL